MFSMKNETVIWNITMKKSRCFEGETQNPDRISFHVGRGISSWGISLMGAVAVEKMARERMHKKKPYITRVSPSNRNHMPKPERAPIPACNATTPFAVPFCSSRIKSATRPTMQAKVVFNESIVTRKAKQYLKISWKKNAELFKINKILSQMTYYSTSKLQQFGEGEGGERVIPRYIDLSPKFIMWSEKISLSQLFEE